MVAQPDLALPISKQTSAIPTDPIWRLSVAQYHHMMQTGILADGDPIELLEGWLVEKMTKNPAHSFAALTTRDVLAGILPTGWIVNIKQPITTSDSEPEPDIAIVRGSRRDYVERHPHPNEIALVIEVADTTLQRDRTVKLRIYANARIPWYWIINLQERRVEVYAQPSGEGYQAHFEQHHDFLPSESITLIIDGQEIARISAADLFA